MPHYGPSANFRVSIETVYVPFVSPRLISRLTEASSAEGGGGEDGPRWWEIAETAAAELLAALDALALARVPFLASFGQMKGGR